MSLDTSKTDTTEQASLKRKNFLSVASRNSSDHLSYHRDLVMLLGLSMASREYNLALELGKLHFVVPTILSFLPETSLFPVAYTVFRTLSSACSIVGEVVDTPTLVQKISVVTVLLQNLREISRDSLDQRRADTQDEVSGTLKRVIRLFRHLSGSFLATDECPVSVPGELHALLEYQESLNNAKGKGVSREVTDLLHLLAREALPSDFLSAFSMWSATHDELSDTVHVLQSVLTRGARRALKTELSGSLLRLRRAREHRSKSLDTANTVVDEKKDGHKSTIWNLMSRGLVPVDK